MRDVESSPRLYARAGGALYLILIVLGAFAEGVRDKVIVSGDITATAANIAANDRLWRLGIASEFVSLICATALAMIYFVLLQPVSRELNLLATFLRLVAIAIQGLAVLNLDAALFPGADAASLKLAIRMHSHGWGLALLFFGACFLVHGRLIYKSDFLPAILGVLIQIAGVCYLTNSFALFLSPATSNRIFPAILIPSFIGEASLCLWLLIKGVDAEKWRQVNARRK